MWERFEIRNFELLFIYSCLTMPTPEKHTSKFNKEIVLLCCLGNGVMYQIGGNSICAVLAMFWQCSTVQKYIYSVSLKIAEKIGVSVGVTLRGQRNIQLHTHWCR
jgi:hypothetical protein